MKMILSVSLLFGVGTRTFESAHDDQGKKDDAIADLEEAAQNCPMCVAQAMQGGGAFGGASGFGGMGGFGMMEQRDPTKGEQAAMIISALTPALGMGLGTWMTARGQNKYYGAYNSYLQQCAQIGQAPFQMRA